MIALSHDFVFNYNYYQPLSLFRDRFKLRSDEHVLGDKHKKRMKGMLQPAISNAIKNVYKGNDEMQELIEGFLSAGIPIYKLQNEKLNAILSKKFGKLPSARTITDKYLTTIYKNKVDKIKEMIKGIFLLFLTTDSFLENQELY